jgi:4-phytase/acid phosphatase
MRHGVRAPTWEANRLNRYSSAAWPDFGVPLGYLTVRGAELLRRIAVYDHDRFVEAGLLPASGCAAAPHVYIWADAEQRTLESGRVFVEALQTGCTVPVHSRAAEDGKDALFDPIAAGRFRADTAAQLAAVRARIGDSAEFVGRLRPAFKTLHEILNGTGAAAERPFADPPVVDVAVTPGGVGTRGPPAGA